MIWGENPYFSMGQKKLVGGDFTLQAPEKIGSSIRMASNELTEEFCQDIIFPDQ